MSHCSSTFLPFFQCRKQLRRSQWDNFLKFSENVPLLWLGFRAIFSRRRPNFARPAHALESCFPLQLLTFRRAASKIPHALTPREHAVPTCQLPPRLLYSEYGPQSPPSWSRCCDFRGGVMRPFSRFLRLFHSLKPCCSTVRAACTADRGGSVFLLRRRF